ncbi:MAG TPA: hypothetical protein VFA18_12025, partial [Gemmataceae bacterium]|nr:hypothetical protein [Gemmataceae bacterium]
RPYMRARQRLADALWTAGRRDEAVQHLQDMLRLNPNDNQGMRYTLASYLLFLDRDDDLAKLLPQYDDVLATWSYTRALLAFRQQGDTLESRKLLKQARKANKHVPAYLLGEKFPPDGQPAYYSVGEESEALEYIRGFLSAWKSTPGAIAWLRQHTQAKKRKPAPAAKGPLDLIKKWLTKHLSQAPAVWQADRRQMPHWVGKGGQPVRPWIILVIDRNHDLVLAHTIAEERPSAKHVWDTLVQAMQHPLVGTSHRPTELQVKPDEDWESLRPHLEEIGIRLTMAEQLPEMEVVFDGLCEHVCGKRRPGLLDVPGVTPALVSSFYDAAASFFQQAPWKKVGYESALRVECDKFQSGPWYAVLMGQSGLATGVALYEDLRALQRALAGNQADEENARQAVATSVTFGEEWETPVADVDAAKKYGWKVARPDAYPEIFHKERGMSLRPPLAWELELTEGCLRAIPDFVARHPQDDPTREEITVPVASGSLKLALSWIEE